MHELGVVWDVDFGARRTTTDARGRFRLDGLAPGPYTITAASGIGRAQRRAAGAGSRLDLILVPSGSVSGAVTGPDGRPSPSTLVRLEPLAVMEGSAGRLVATDAAGRFEFSGVEPGRYRVVARHAALAPAWQAVAVERARQAGVSFRLAAGFTVAGRLADAEDRPVAGQVVVSALDGAAPPRSLAADLSADAPAEGGFRLTRVPPGSVTFTAAAGRFAPRRIDVALADKRPERDLGTITLESGLAIHGVVQDGRGRPVADAQVNTQRGVAGLPAAATTGADGAFTLGGLEAGRYRVSAQAPGIGKAERDVEAGGDRVVLVVQQTGGITGAVVDATGAPVRAYRVVARPQPSLSRPSAGGLGARLDVESADGRFAVDDLPPGTYVLALIAPDREPGGVSQVVVTPGEVVDVGAIRLDAGGVVRGVVVDAGGAAVAGAVVSAALPRRMMLTLAAASETGSDATGAFELRGVPAGAVRVTARHPEYVDAEAVVEVDPAVGPADARVVLARGGRIEGYARRGDGSAAAGSVAVQPVSGGGVPPLSPSLNQPLAADGSFSIDRVPVGRARVVLMSGTAGWARSAREREVEIREGQTTAVAFDLQEIVVGGRVTRAGEGVPNLRVTFVEETPAGPAVAGAASGPSGPRRHTAVTAEDGSYRLHLDQPGLVRVTCDRADGSLHFPSRVVEIPDVEHHLLDLAFGGVVLAGTVLDEESQEPLAHVNVVAGPTRHAGDGRVLSAVTGPDGRFQIEVGAGAYRVAAQVAGYAGATAEVEVPDSGVSDLLLSLVRGGTIRGRVVDSRGRPAGDGIVRAVASRPGGGAGAAMLLPDGRFEITGLQDAEHTLVARSDAGSFALHQGVLTGAEDVTLVMRRGGRIQLKLVGPDGAPVAGASASVFRVGAALAAGITGSSVSDAQGRAEILSPSGDVEVRVTKIENAAVVSATATVMVEEGGTATAEVVLTRPVASLSQD